MLACAPGRLVGVVGSGLALAVGWVGCGPRPAIQPSKPLVRYEIASLGHEQSLRNTQTYLATIRGDKETDLSFKVPGILELIGPETSKDWEEGRPVGQAEMLARLKQADFTNAVIQAKAKADLDRSRLERSRRLGDDISRQDLEVLEAAQKTSQAAWEQTRQALADSELRAPFAATILSRLASSGETVLPGRPVLRLADLGTMSVELGVPDRIVGGIKVDQEIPVSISALEGTNFVGRVSEVGVAAKEGARLFKVVLKLNNRGGLIKSGMTASVSFLEAISSPTNAVLVPLSALVAAAPARGQGPPSLEGRTQLAVFVIGANNQVQERLVQTDEIIRNAVLITEGVKPGDKVVVVGASTLQDGDLVNPLPVEGSEQK